MTKLRSAFRNQQVVVSIFFVNTCILGGAIARTVPQVESSSGVTSLHVDDLCLNWVTSVCNNNATIIVEEYIWIDDVGSLDSKWHRPSRVICCVLGGEEGGRQWALDVGGDEVEGAVMVTKGGSKYSPSLDVVALVDK